MEVKLVSKTQPLVEDKELSLEEYIVYCARVSNPNNQLNTETAPKLLKYCIKHGHWSVLEQGSLGFSIKTSRAIAAQIIRHRSFHFQEFSQRYSNVTQFEDIETRKQGKTNRQVGDEPFDPILFYKLVQNSNGSQQDVPVKASEAIQYALDAAEDLYGMLLKCNVAKECARMILPMASTSHLYMTGTIRDWVHYINVRTEEGTQKEHRDIANKIKEIFVQELPVIAEALDWK